MEQKKGKLSHSPFHYVAQMLKVIFLCSFIISCVWMINHFRISKYFPITTVRVYGLNRVEQRDVKQLLMPLLTHGFFGVNVEYIRDRLLQHPWVYDISVRRHWPDQIEVTIFEKKAVAKWNNQILLSETGVLFIPKVETYPANLPVFSGPSGKQIIMLNYFNKINRILIPLRVKISYLELTPYLTWKLALNNGINLQMGHKDILSRLAQFVSVYPKIVGDHAADVDSVDLRYPNGVAVRWKTPV
jgi:cell division protein FtsQ